MLKLIPESCPTLCSHSMCRKYKMWKLSLEFLLSTGCREGEMSNLEVINLDRKTHGGYFYNCKHNSDRPFILDPEFFQRLCKFIEEENSKG